MNKKLMFVLFAVLMMAVMTVSVSADQLANDRWCNSDQYGCWVTGDNGAQDYIMFWSESAREYFMGPGSNAVVTDPYPAGKMPLDPAPASEKSLKDILFELFAENERLYYEYMGYDFKIEYVSWYPEYISSWTDQKVIKTIQSELDYKEYITGLLNDKEK